MVMPRSPQKQAAWNAVRSRLLASLRGAHLRGVRVIAASLVGRLTSQLVLQLSVAEVQVLALDPQVPVEALAEARLCTLLQPGGGAVVNEAEP